MSAPVLVGYTWRPACRFDIDEHGIRTPRWTGFECLYESTGKQVFSSSDGFGSGAAVMRAAAPPDRPPPPWRNGGAR